MKVTRDIESYKIRLLDGLVGVNAERADIFLDIDDQTLDVSRDAVMRRPSDMVGRIFAAGFRAARVGDSPRLPIIGDVD